MADIIIQIFIKNSKIYTDNLESKISIIVIIIIKYYELIQNIIKYL